MIHYPVLIPTLNRANHLKRCLDSLAHNTGAEDTEVFISVDYPPSKKYEDGYLEVKSYLSRTVLSCFKTVYIFYQEQNLGPVGNSDFLKKKIQDMGYDGYIYTEDDNEFAPNFLPYMNDGLQKFKDNQKVLAVCGAKDTDWETNGKNITYCKLLAAYGVGEWFEKTNAVQNLGLRILLPQKIYGPRIMFTLLQKNTCLFNLYVLSMLCTDKGFYWPQPDTLRWCDSTYSIYMHLSDAVCIAPAVPKSRTWGNDGSGVNMGKRYINPEEEWILDSEKLFVCDDISDQPFFKENYTLGSKYLSTGQRANTIKAILAYMLILLCGRKRSRILKITGIIRKALKKEI